MTRQDTVLPVVVIGAGPVGLAAAANLVERELDFLVLEAGDAVGASVSEWGHIQMFSPWRYTIDEASARVLGEAWNRPDADRYPFGAEMVERYLTPLASVPAIAEKLMLGTKVVSVARRGMDRSQSLGRESTPFVVAAVGSAGPFEIEASAVIDASGTWQNPNPAVSTGLVDEASRDGSRTAFHAPDVLGADVSIYGGSSVAVVGSGHTAQNVLRHLVSLQTTGPATRITWLVRRRAVGSIYGGGAADELPERGALGSWVERAVHEGKIKLVTGFRTASVVESEESVLITSDTGEEIRVGQLVVATGARPDYSLASELRLDLDPVTEATRALGPLIDPNVHSCGNVEPHGHRELAHPERDFYTLGMKSYGRAPTFLLPTGYEQARSVVAALAGDMEAADAVFFDLPETGVCSGGPASEDLSEADSCCGPEPASVVESLPERVKVPVAVSTSGCC